MQSSRRAAAGIGLRAVATVAVSLATALVTGVVARASVGIGVQADPVRLTGAAHAGGTYQLPPVYVVNTGSDPESVSVAVRAMGAQHGMAVPASWVQADEPSGDLAPQQAVRIPLELTAPADARPGRYTSDIVVTGTSDATGNVRFSAAAATGLEFTISQAPPSGFAAWRLWTAAVLLLAGGAALIVRWRTGNRPGPWRTGNRPGPWTTGNHPGRQATGNRPWEG